MAWDSVKEKKGEAKRTATDKVIELRPTGQGPSSETAGGKDRDLRGGMELLELDFLLSIVENTEGNDGNDVTMRKLNFNELLRRAKQDQIDSNALGVYVVNAGNLYGKDIQCAATKELTKRTAQ